MFLVMASSFSLQLEEIFSFNVLLGPERLKLLYYPQFLVTFVNRFPFEKEAAIADSVLLLVEIR